MSSNSTSSKQTVLEQEALEIKRAQKDSAQFEVLYKRYFLPVFRFVRQRVGSHHDAGDITSLVFAKALHQLHRFEPRGIAFGSWLFRLASNEVNNHYRQLKKERTLFVSDRDSETMADWGGEELHDQNPEERRSLLIQLLRELPQADVELIELRFFEQRSFREIAEILQLTETNARVKVHRVVDKMRRMIKSKKS
ncbi:sigma-70 family RNA polymerase sigma factor [bacterium SCSIO 12741]|nr:sigma-70 family RNA polymerase sigma factor [bacterium SCSIO 12741]